MLSSFPPGSVADTMKLGQAQVGGLPTEGITSTVYDAGTNGGLPTTIGATWVAEVARLSSRRPFGVRCIFTPPAGGWRLDQDDRLDVNDANLRAYKEALGLYSAQGMKAYVVFFGNHGNSQDSVKDPVGTALNNGYIEAFSTMIAELAAQLKPPGSGGPGGYPDTFVIWNEQNFVKDKDGNPDKNGIPAENYAALMYQCYRKLWDVLRGGFRLVTGGLGMPLESHQVKGATAPDEYLATMYSTLADAAGVNPDIKVPMPGHPEGLPITDRGPWPWHGVDLQIYWDKWADSSATQRLLPKTVQDFVSGIRAVRQTQRGDFTPIFIGEWGAFIQQECGTSGQLKTLHDWIVSLIHPDAMYVFTDVGGPEGSGKYAHHFWEYAADPGGQRIQIHTERTILYDAYAEIVGGSTVGALPLSNCHLYPDQFTPAIGRFQGASPV